MQKTSNFAISVVLSYITYLLIDIVAEGWIGRFFFKTGMFDGPTSLRVVTLCNYWSYDAITTVPSLVFLCAFYLLLAIISFIILRKMFSKKEINKVKNNKKFNPIITNLLQKSLFKLSLLLSGVLGIYGTQRLAHDCRDFFINAFTGCSAFYYFFVLLLGSLFTTISVVRIFKEDQFHILRFENRKQYFTSVLKYCLRVNFIYILCSILILFICINIFQPSFLTIKFYDSLHTYNIIYFFFYFFKFFAFSLCFTFINTLLLYLIDYKSVLVLNVILYSIVDVLLLFIKPLYVDGIGLVPFLVTEYLLPTTFESFSIEIVFTLGYLLIMITLALILFKYTLKKCRSLVL